MSKIQSVHQHLESLVDKSRPHDGLPSERTLQKTFAVSRETIRRAFDQLILSGRIYRKAGSGTYVSPPKRFRTILIVGPESPPETGLATYFPPFLMSLLSNFRQVDGSLLPVFCSNVQFLAEADELQTLYPDLSAVIIFNLAYLLVEQSPMLRKIPVPVLYAGVDTCKIPSKISALLVRETHIVQAALRALGAHEGIPIAICGPRAGKPHGHRLDIFARECGKMGVHPLKIPATVVDRESDFHVRAAGDHRAISWIKSRRGPLAVFCTTDLAAIHLVNAAHGAGIPIPGTLRVIGVEGAPLGELAMIPVSQVSVSFTELARHCVPFVLDLMGGGRVRVEEMPVQVKIRASTLPISNG